MMSHVQVCLVSGDPPSISSPVCRFNDLSSGHLLPLSRCDLLLIRATTIYGLLGTYSLDSSAATTWISRLQLFSSSDLDISSATLRLEMADLPLELYHESKRKKRKRAAAVFFVSVVSIAQHMYCKRKILELGDFSEEEAETRIRKQMLRNIYLGPNQYCYDSLRFTKRSFFDLCAMLRERAGLKDTFYMSVEEAVTIFLLVLGHGMKFRLIRSIYRWTLEPVSRHFNEVLGAVLSLSHELIKLPDPAAELPEDNRWKWFPDGLGALDGTHVPVRVAIRKQGRYRNRKHEITTNVLGVCDRSMKFVYVLAGWEGSASDGRVLRDAMFREDAFKVPSGKYYLVDAGYTNGPGFLAPFRSTRYHLKEWAAVGNNPETPEELYNLRHASARNIVERIFAFIKMRWAILRSRSFFGIRNQARAP